MRKRLPVLAILVGLLPGVAGGRPLAIATDIGYGFLAQRAGEHHGLAVGLQAHIEATASLLVGARFHYGVHPGDAGTTHAGTALVSLVFQFDVVHWVPSATLEGGLLWSRRPGGGTDAEGVIAFGLGVDRLLSRSWAVGLHARFHLVPEASDGFPGYFLIGPRLTFRWE